MNESDRQLPPGVSAQNPREFMRARRPYLFSDTTRENHNKLPKAVFEYHLETLTNRKQEYEFEHFCRKLAERELCPNLRPQTGPTGGGDSKVDSETYPVSERIAARWWIGTPSSGSERWGFAFSAKKDWKSKVRSDVEKILSTPRNYQLIYFFTSQFVRDKERADLEDNLTQANGVRVCIIDRLWIVEKVYSGEHLDLAVSDLALEGVETEQVRQIGPNDTARLRELEQLDKDVLDVTRYEGAKYQLVEDCLRSAILARGLERPQSEIEARFHRAERLAREVNYQPQQLRVAYNQAWTAFWWNEDLSEFIRFYDIVENLATGIDDSNALDLLLNLWMLLHTAAHTGDVANLDTRIEPKSRKLIASFNEMASDITRPNRALEARTNIILMKTTQAYYEGDEHQVEAGWMALSELVDQCVASPTYPLEKLFGIVSQLGELLDSPALDDLFDKLVGAIRHRRSDGEAGEAYTRRGIQKFRQDKPYQSIIWFGKAEELLLKEEYRVELIMTLVGSAHAYERVGLLWAARSKILVAADRALSSFHESGTVTHAMLRTLERLIWIELQLGRIPHVLNCLVFSRALASHLVLSEDEKVEYDEIVNTQDLILGIHMLNTPIDLLSKLAQLPDTLEQLGLANARLALLYALGHEEFLRGEGSIPADEDSRAMAAVFERWHDQPAREDISQTPSFSHDSTCFHVSTVLGIRVVVSTPNNATSVSVAESLLGALEAYLATSDEEHLFPHKSSVCITISETDDGCNKIRSTFPEAGVEIAEIEHSVDLSVATLSEQEAYLDWLQDTLIRITCTMVMIKDVEAWMAKVAGEERGLARAFTLANMVTMNRNVFGESPRLCLGDWTNEENRSFTLNRRQLWKRSDGESQKGGSRVPKFGVGPPPRHLTDRERLRHSDKRVTSPIDIRLWDRANWRGTLFLWQPSSPPILGLGFERLDAGLEIFREWCRLWGNDDKGDNLRVAIISGVSSAHPGKYSVIVGPNFNTIGSDDEKVHMFVSRVNRMTPKTTRNLDMFVSAYKRMGAYLLMPANLDLEQPRLDFELAILKRNLVIRKAWEIGENDPDICAIEDDDDPLLPTDVEDPPILRALKQRRTRGWSDRGPAEK